MSYYENNKALYQYEEEEINQISNDNETEKYYYELNRKVHINLAFIGNKNSGKSTTIGHLLYNTGNIQPGYFNWIKNLANEMMSRTYKFSWLIDIYKEEREARKTTFIHLKKFETKKYDFDLINLPGDLTYRKNIFKGISLADAAIIIVSAENENYENNHIKDYLIVAFTTGIRQIIIAINKMDQTKDVEYSEKFNS